MTLREFLRIVLPHVLDAAIILFLAVSIPIVLLLLYWEKLTINLLGVLALANGLQKVAEVLLIILPLATLYLATCIAFARPRHQAQALGGSIFSLFYVGPVSVLLICQPILYYFIMSSRKHAALDSDEMTMVTSAVIAALLSLLVLETYMSVCRGLSEIQVPSIPPKPSQGATSE